MSYIVVDMTGIEPMTSGGMPPTLFH